MNFILFFFSVRRNVFGGKIRVLLVDVYPSKRYVEVLTPTTSECDPI